MRILIAEDDGFSRRFLGKTLVQWGYEPVLVSDGRQAWEQLRAEDPPRLALLDWMMPEMDGLEVCRKVRESQGDRSTYILMLTASDHTTDLISAINAGADDFVTKSFDVRELEVRLRAAKRIVELEEALWTLAMRDPMTKLWNHGAILEVLERELDRAARTDSHVGLVVSDIDFFKHVNDTYGHKGGDAAILQVTERMRDVVRNYDTVGRYGGEEFVVVLPGAMADGAAQVAERLRERMASEPFNIEGQRVPITMSFGVVVAQDRTSGDSDALIRAADAALYRAKNGGRNRVEIALAEETVEVSS